MIMQVHDELVGEAMTWAATLLPGGGTEMRGEAQFRFGARR
jgi:hypothetical protein